MPIIPVVAAIIEHNGTFLACRRRQEKVAGGQWEFPGGKVEIGESPKEALEREIQEELGVTITQLSELNTHDTRVGEHTIRLTCFLARLVSELPTQSTDHDQLTWASPQELTLLEWAAPDLPAVQLLVDRSVSSTE